MELRDVLSVLSDCIGIITMVTFALYFYMPLYTVVGFFTTRRFPKAHKQHKYAVMIAARNEKAVIGNLIDSIKAQDYPAELVTVFVVADNCTDSTATVARDHGAVCYERFDNEHRTKGYALEFLVENIRRDYGIESFEAYFIFDADNLLKKDYISRMNEAFDAGEKIVTSYRNTKNFNDNWIAAGYGLHWLRTVRAEHRPRSFFGLATRIQGTGFMFANDLIRDGWHYVSFTEDRAFAADAVVKGYRISYCDAAEFYDEQPTSLRIAFRQRIRWGKGHLQAFVESGGKLIRNVFLPKSAEVQYTEGKNSNTRLRFMSYDMFLVTFPNNLISITAKLFDFITAIVLTLYMIGASDSVPVPIFVWAAAFAASYFGNIFMSIYVFFTERRRIQHIGIFKKIWYCLMWPMFDLIGGISVLIALFTKVEWKPIPHNVSVTVDMVSESIDSKKQ